MEKDGEYGEFFPTQGSDYAYNESVASEYYPLTKEEVLAKGWKWRDKVGGAGRDEGGECLHCKDCNSAYRTMEQELNFYENMGLPAPDICPECRHKKRFEQRNPRELFSRECMKCSKKLESAYSPDSPQIVYCEECILKEQY